jgi:hypothetical protein
LVTISNIQIEEATAETGWEPYAEPIVQNIFLDEPLRRIGKYADYIDFKKQKIVRNTFIRVYNGTITNSENPFNKDDNEANWAGTEVNADNNENFWEFSLNDTLPIIPKYQHSSAEDYKQVPFCLQLPAKTGSFSSVTDPPKVDRELIWFCNQARGVRIFLSKDRIGGTRNNLITYLKANPISVLIATYTPYEEDISCQLPKTIAKTTIIEADTSIPSSNMKTKYIGK